MKSSPLKAREVEALTFIYTPTETPAAGDAAPNENATARALARPLLGAAVALVVFATLAWILTAR